MNQQELQVTLKELTNKLNYLLKEYEPFVERTINDLYTEIRELKHRVNNIERQLRIIENR